MTSRSDTKGLADATTKLGRTVAEALRSWTEEVGADDIASDVMDRVREGFDVFLENAKEAADKARATAQGATKRAKRTTKKAKSTAKKAAKKARKKVGSTAPRKTTRKTPTKKKTTTKKKKTVRKKT